MTAVTPAMREVWPILKRMTLRFRLWRLERKIDFRRWDRGLSLEIDAVLSRLEGGHRP